MISDDDGETAQLQLWCILLPIYYQTGNANRPESFRRLGMSIVGKNSRLPIEQLFSTYFTNVIMVCHQL